MKNLNIENFRISPSIVDIEKPEFGVGNRGAFPYFSIDELPPVKKNKRKNKKFNLILGFKDFFKKSDQSKK